MANKPTMDRQLVWLQDLELKLALIRQRLVMLNVPRLDDVVHELGDIVHDIRNKRTIAENWKEVSEQNGFIQNGE